MEKCTFCNEELTPGTGKMYIKKDGKIWYFCSRTCEKNMLKLHRKPSEQKWITKQKKTGGRK